MQTELGHRPEDASEDTAAPQLRQLQANGIDFAYLEAGEGPLVLCLHGFPDTAWSFQPLLGQLAAAGFHGVAPFMRGYAPSGLAPDGDYRLHALAFDAIALVDHFGAPRASLVGHDWGAVASYGAATLRPDRFERVVTAAVPHLRRFLLRPTWRQLHRSGYMFRFQLPRWAESRLPRDDFAWIRRLVQEWSPAWAFDDSELEPLRAALREPAHLQAALAYYRALPRWLFDSEQSGTALAPMPLPTRMIYGARDGCIGPEMFAQQEHLFLAGLDLQRMETGHFMHREQPEEFGRLVLEFLRR